MLKESLHIYTINAQGNKVPFPSAQEFAVLSEWTYTAERMSSAPAITGSLMHRQCLDDLWTQKEFVEFKGERYYVDLTPTSSKNTEDVRYRHDITFISERMVIENVFFFDVVTSDTEDQYKDRYRSNGTKFSFYGTLHELVSRLNDSLIYTKLYSPATGEGYHIVIDEGIDVTEEKELSLENVYFATALQEIYNQFKVPYYWVGKTCHVGYAENVITTPFAYGQGKGLLSVKKTNADYRIINRITGIGSSDNIPYYYPNEDAYGIPVFDTENIDKSQVSISLSDVLKANNDVFENTYTLCKAIGTTGMIELSKFKLNCRIESNGNLNPYSWMDRRPEYTGDYAYVLPGTDVKGFPCVINLGKRFSTSSGSTHGIVPFSCEINGYKGSELDFKDFSFDVAKTDNRYPTVSLKTEVKYYIGEWDNQSVKKEEEIGNGVYTFVQDGKYRLLIEIHIDVVNKKDLPGEQELFAFLWLYGVISYKYIPKDEFYFKTSRGDKSIPYSKSGIELQNINYVQSLINRFEYSDGMFIEVEDASSSPTPVKITIADRIWITPTGALMPPIYRESQGAERFYNALNDVYDKPEGGKYIFSNIYTNNNQKEGFKDFTEIKPSIKGIKNAAGQLLGEIADIAFDSEDSDLLSDDNSNEYVHSYFYIKLHVFNGIYGFNLLNQALESGAATINMTSGNCAGCAFELGFDKEVDGDKYIFRNPVMTDSGGSLLKVQSTGDKGYIGDYIQKNKSDYVTRQQDTSQYEVWVAVKKDNSTFGVVMPNATNNYKPKIGDKFVITNILMPHVYISKAENELKNALIKYMSENNDEKFTFNITFSRIYLQQNPKIANLLNENARLIVNYNGHDYILYVSSYSCKTSEDILSDINVEVTDNLVTGQSSLRDKITDVAQTIINDVSIMDTVARMQKYFLSKKSNDTAQGLIRLLQGLLVGNGAYGIDDNGDALLHNVVTVGEQRSADYVAAEQTGYGIVRRTDGKYGLHITDLEVWGRATFSALEIMELNYVGGNFVFSPAGGRIAHVEELRSGGEISGWRCYFLAGDGTAETRSMWREDDQMLCETFNVEKVTSYQTGNKRYWRRVTGVSQDNVQIYGPDGTALYDGNKFAWTDISAADCEEGSDIPAAGDTVAVFGNRTDEGRQNVITIETSGEGAPAIRVYKGIDSYSLAGRCRTQISPTAGSWFTGSSFEIETGGGSVRVPADRGEWQQGVAYYNYNRVSHGGNLWLCTVAEGQRTYEEPNAGAKHWTAQTKTGDGALGISGDGQDVVVPADHAGHPLYCERRIVMSVRLGQEPVVISSAELGVDTARIQDLEDFLWVDDVYDGTVEILLQYSDTINEQSLDMLIEQGDIPVKITYREDFGAADEKTVTAHFHLVKVKDGADGKDGEKGDKGDDGKDAWQVAVTPQVLAIESSAAGTVGAGELTGARAVVSVRRGQRDIGVREIRNIRTEHCTAEATADGAIRITKVSHYKLEGRTFAYGSGWVVAEVVSETDTADGASVTADVRVDFTVAVTAQTASLSVRQDGIETRVEEISNKTGTLETSVSEIRQTAESISLKVDRTAVSGRNLIPCSYLRMVTSTYGVALRKVRIYGGRDYTLSVNGHIDSVLKGDGRRLAAFVWIAGEDGAWIWSASAHIDSLEDVTASVTFSLPEDMTGLHEVNTGCFPLMDGGPQYEGTGMMTVNWMQLEEGTVATPWSPSAEDMAVQGNLLPGIDRMVRPQGGAAETTEVRLEEGGYTDGSGQVLDVVYGRNGNAAGGSVVDACVFTGLTVEGDMTYTLSFWARGTGQAVSHLWTDGRDVTSASYAGDGTIRGAGDGYCVTEITAEWRRYMLTWTTRYDGGGEAGVIPLRLWPGSEAWICGIKLELHGRATEYTLKGVTEKELLATGIDISRRKITLTADMLEVRNNSGEVTAKINGDGVLETTGGIFKGTVRADAGYFNNGTFDKGEFNQGIFRDITVTGNSWMKEGVIGGFKIDDESLIAQKGPLRITPAGIEFRPGNGNVAYVGSTNNIVAAFYSDVSSFPNYSLATGAQFGAKGATGLNGFLNAAIDITEGVLSGLVRVTMEVSSSISIVCSNNVTLNSDTVKHVRSGGIFVLVGDEDRTITLPNSPADGTMYTFVGVCRGRTVLNAGGSDKICVNTYYTKAGNSYVLGGKTGGGTGIYRFENMTLVYFKGYWYGVGAVDFQGTT